MQKLRASAARFWLIGAAVSCFLFATGKVLLPAQQQPPPTPSIHVEVKEVLVPVIVTDRKGHYIPNLTAKDFRVLDDGVAQKIVAFSGSTGGASSYFKPQPVESGVGLPNQLVAASEQPAATPSSYVICLDTVHSTVGSYNHIRRALQKFFTRERPADAGYALVTLGVRVKVIQNLTRDPDAILAALNEKELKTAFTQSEGLSQFEEETDLARSLTGYCEQECDCTSGQDPLRSGNSCAAQWESIEERAAAEAENRGRIARVFLQNLQGLVERLGEVPGRRTIILVSDGFNMRPGEDLYSLMASYSHAPGVLLHNTAKGLGPQVEDVLRAAQRRDVIFYTLNSRGVYMIPTSGLGIRQQVVNPDPFRRSGSQIQVRVGNAGSGLQAVASGKQGALKELAAQTGGLFYQHSNDFLNGLRQGFEDGKSYYLLAYVPTSLVTNGKFHKIKVEVNQPHAVVRAKKGYWAPGQTLPGGRHGGNSPTGSINKDVGISAPKD